MAHACASTSARSRTDDGDPRCADARMHEIELELDAGDPRRLFELAQALAADVPLRVRARDQGRARLRAARGRRGPTPARADDIEPAGKCDRRRRASPRSCAQCLRADRRQRARRRVAVSTIRSGSTRCASACAACARASRSRDAASRTDAHRAAARRDALARARRSGPRATSTCSSPRRCPAFRDAVARGAERRAGARAAPAARRAPSARRREARRCTRSRASRRRASCASCSRPRRSRPRPTSCGVARTTASSPRRRASSRVRCSSAGTRRWSRRADLAHAAPEARHAARLAAKKLRYATEFFASLYPAEAHARLPQGARRAAGGARRVERRGGRGAPRRRAHRADRAGDRRVRRLGRGAQAQRARRGDSTEAWPRFTKARPFWSRPDACPTAHRDRGIALPTAARVAARRSRADDLPVLPDAGRRCAIAASASPRPTATSGTSTGSTRRHATDAPLVVLFHGLEGGATSHYARALMARARRARLARRRPAFPRLRRRRRTCLPRAYHSGDHEEVGAMLAAVRERVEPRSDRFTRSASRSAAARC